MMHGPNSSHKPMTRQRWSRNTTLHVRDCIVLVAGDSDLYVDKNFIKVFGYDDPREVSEKPFSMLVHPEDRDRVEEIHRKRSRGDGAPDHYEFKGICRDGTSIHLEVSATSLKYNGQTLSAMYLRDITTRKRWEEELRESEEKYRTLFENSMDAIYITGRDARLVDANEAFLNLFGYTREEAIGLNGKEAISSQDLERFKSIVRKKGYVKDFSLKLARKDGETMDCLLTLNPMVGEGGKTTGYQGIVRDITAYKKAQEAVQYMAYHDSLTGLPNRILFSDRLTMAIVNATRNKQRIAVMMLDLDRFKDVNDTLGHDVGDRLLKAVADRLLDTVRKSDTVARMGGDEFLLVLPEINTVNDTIVVSDKIMEAFRRPFSTSSHELFITCSVGMAIYPEHGTDPEVLIRNADTAMYRVKHLGRNGYRLCDTKVFEGNPPVEPRLSDSTLHPMKS